MSVASLKAATTGETVEVTAKRTETSELYANPDGSFTQDTYAVAQRVRKNGKLVDIDTTLQALPDGTYTARATEVDVRFSGGGNGPLATVIRDGRSLSIRWPHELPTPVIDGDSAVYPNVFKDVDLKLTAGSAGFGELLVVKTPEAAANPELASLTFPMATDGLAVSADEHGNLRATNPAGQEVFTAPTPLMWDSVTATDDTGPAARSLAEEPTEPTTPPTQDFEPPVGAHTAAIKVTTDGDSLDLTPDTSLLNDPDTTYPVYLDPSISGSREAWTIVTNDYPNTAYWNGNGWDEGDGNKVTSYARIGWPGDTLSKSYFRMDTNNLWNTDKVISKSIFRIKNSYSYSCTNRPVEVARTGSISSSTTWNNRPAWIETYDTVNDSLGYNTSCPAGNLAFDVTKGAKAAASGHWNNLTLGMRVPISYESDKLAYKRFTASSAVLSTTYNTVPNVPTGLYTSPDSGKNCGATTPYTVIGNTDITLGGKFTDSDGGTIKAHFILWPTGHGGANNEVNSIVSTTSGTISKLVVSKTKLASLLNDAGVTGTGTFTWYARTEDSTTTSAFSTQCHFNFDGTRPSHPPTVTSAQYPDGSDGWPENTSTARTEGTFTLGNGGVSDVTKYEYWTDWDPTVRTAAPSTAGGSQNVKLTPVSAGAHFLYARSIDQGGNTSDRTAYLFYVNSPNIKDEPGDLNGDGNSDLYGVGTDGVLRQYSGTGDGTLSVYSVGSSTNFNGASITHRGDWTDDGYEDLIAASGAAGSKVLQLYPNNGYGYACTTTGEQTDSGTCTASRQELTVYDPANNHWQDADQILAIGDVDGPLDADGDGTTDVPGFPDLLVKEGDLLWLYYGASSYHLDETLEPVLIGTSGWADYDLTAPGDVDNNGHPDILARQKSTGDLYLYPGTGPAGEGLGSGPTRAQIGTGWTTTSRPLITSGGDANNDGTPDLWATSPDTGKGLYFYPTVTSTGHGTPVAVGTNGWLDFQTLS